MEQFTIRNFSGNTNLVFAAKDDNADFGRCGAGAMLLAFEKSRRPNPTVILPTGNTVKSAYSQLRELGYHLPPIRYVNYDQYKGIEFGDPRSYPLEISKEFLIPHKQVLDFNLVFDGMAANPLVECTRMEKALIDAGGIDIAFIGIGTNSHHGFNEPGTDFNSLSHLVTLTNDTKVANQPHCEKHGGVPDQAYTQGTASVLGARQICGLFNKPAQTLKSFTEAPTTDIPMSALQSHKDMAIIATPSVAKALRPYALAA